MKERMKKVLAVILAIFTIVTINYFYTTGIKKVEKIQLEKNLNTKEFVYNNVNIKESNYGKDIYKVAHNKEITPFNILYQEVVDEKINKLLEKEYTFEKPLMIYNPYGTNKNSLNIYFKTEQESQVEYTVKVKGLEDFTRILKNDNENNLTTTHKYQIIGLVMNKKNTLVLKLKDKEGKIVDEKEFEIDFTNLKSTVATKLKVKEGSSKEELSDGLYVMFGHDKAYNANNYLYDNNGILRSELILEGYRSDRIIFVNDAMIYSYKGNGFIKVNGLGKIEKKYSIGPYTMHHDYVLDQENENLIILANKNDADTIEDRVLSLNLNTGKVKEIIDMKDYLEEMHNAAIRPKKNTYGGTELDWVHLNSLDIIDGEDAVFSSRELSMIIYMENIYRNPKVKYVITDPSTLENTTYQELNYKKVGDFISQAGQHTITYEEKDTDEYYLYMYNNNYQGARTRPKFNWKNYAGTGTYQEGHHSSYYKYLVNENDKTYELIKEIKLPYSSIVSSVEQKEENFVTSSGMSHCFNEYDKDGNLIKEFQYTSKKYAYRIFKYEFNGIWFS